MAIAPANLHQVALAVKKNGLFSISGIASIAPLRTDSNIFHHFIILLHQFLAAAFGRLYKEVWCQWTNAQGILWVS
jgi:hypothetical protein